MPAGIDLVAFEVPESMVVSSITLAPAVTSKVEEEIEETRHSGRYPRGR